MTALKDRLGSIGGLPQIVDSSSTLARSNVHSMLGSQPYTMFGLVSKVLPPSHPENRSKNQYEYFVKCVGIKKSHVGVHCVLVDGFGGNNDHEYHTLKINQRVIVSCFLGDAREGVIIGGLRNRVGVENEGLGHRWFKRFNKFNQGITNDNVHYIKHDDGNEIRIEPTLVSVKDGDGQEIKVDKQNKTITIINGEGDVITIDQNKRTISMSTKDMKVNLEGNLDIKVSGTAKIDASDIHLNGSGAGIVTGGTNGTFPYCKVTGIPIDTVKNVKAG